jgi:branched-chain amino acid transport system permease protein
MRAISWTSRSSVMGVPLDLTFPSIAWAPPGATAGTLYAIAFPVMDPYMAYVGGSLYCGGGGRHRQYRGAMIGGFISVCGVWWSLMPSTYGTLLLRCAAALLLIFRPYGPWESRPQMV